MTIDAYTLQFFDEQDVLIRSETLFSTMETIPLVELNACLATMGQACGAARYQLELGTSTLLTAMQADTETVLNAYLGPNLILAR